MDEVSPPNFGDDKDRQIKSNYNNFYNNLKLCFFELFNIFLIVRNWRRRVVFPPQGPTKLFYEKNLITFF